MRDVVRKMSAIILMATWFIIIPFLLLFALVIFFFGKCQEDEFRQFFKVKDIPDMVNNYFDDLVDMYKGRL